MTKHHTHKYDAKKKLARIYCGPAGHETSIWWTVSVTDAKKPVTINGTTAAALRGHPGVSAKARFPLPRPDVPPPGLRSDGR
jgi:hypothetical protein